MRLTESQLTAAKEEAEKPLKMWTQVQYNQKHRGWCVMRGAHNTGYAYMLAGPYSTEHEANSASMATLTPNLYSTPEK